MNYRSSVMVKVESKEWDHYPALAIYDLYRRIYIAATPYYG